MRQTPIKTARIWRLLTVFLLLTALTGCKSARVRELEEYRLNMSRFFENVTAYDKTINAIDPNAEHASEELLRNLDGLNAEFTTMASYPIPDDFASVSEITQDAASSMSRAVALYHEAYTGTFDAVKAAEARSHYLRAGKCVQIIVQVLHGETPSGEGVTILY
ncbi:MAG: hypothetical protein IJQ21_07415 [Lachnospiraceae bacterium]|nr:hypothetical protein [Lachnospiraceae bacterium]